MSQYRNWPFSIRDVPVFQTVMRPPSKAAKSGFLGCFPSVSKWIICELAKPANACASMKSAHDWSSEPAPFSTEKTGINPSPPRRPARFFSARRRSRGSTLNDLSLRSDVGHRLTPFLRFRFSRPFWSNRTLNATRPAGVIGDLPGPPDWWTSNSWSVIVPRCYRSTPRPLSPVLFRFFPLAPQGPRRKD